MRTELPHHALLSRYGAPHYTDCFAADVSGDVSLAEFVYAFYTAPLFRCERFVLGLVGLKSSDDDALALVQERGDAFAAWTVEARSTGQLLMCDARSRTRSWFMVEPQDATTRLYFGSAVIADSDKGPPTSYRVLLKLHRLYSVLLLRGALRRLTRNAS